MLKNARSNVPRRIDGLVHSLFGRGLDADIRGICYQLLHAAVGAMIAGERLGASDAVFLVHKFSSTDLNSRRVSENLADWRNFASLLAGRPATAFANDGIWGPIALPDRAGRFEGIRLFLSSVTTAL
jgi:hypothetical protein